MMFTGGNRLRGRRSRSPGEFAAAEARQVDSIILAPGDRVPYTEFGLGLFTRFIIGALHPRDP
jgi:hypothetical protein